MARNAGDPFFKPGAHPRDKGDHTTSAARAIVEAETAAREKKSARLRKLRLETADPDPVPARKAPARKPGTVAAGRKRP